jgi:hypothetical protein
MCTNYNPAAPAFTNKEVMMQYHGAVSGRLTEDHSHGIECDPEKNAGTAVKYVRGQPVVNGQDLKTFDLGTFQLAQVNVPAAFLNQQVGELWVEYTVRLQKPRLYSSLGANIAEYRVVSQTPTLAFPFGSSPLFMQQNMLNIEFAYLNTSTGNTGWKLTFPDWFTGVVEIQVYMEGSGLPVTSPSLVSIAGNVSSWNDLYGVNGGSGTSPSNQNGLYTAGNVAFVGRWSVQPTVGGVDQVITFPWVFATGSFTQCQLIVRAVNPSFGQTSTNPVPFYVNASGVITSIV